MVRHCPGASSTSAGAMPGHSEDAMMSTPPLMLPAPSPLPLPPACEKRPLAVEDRALAPSCAGNDGRPV